MTAVTFGHEEPGGHSSQPLDLDTKYVPCAQSFEDWQLRALISSVYIQSAQSAHTALVVALHMTLVNWPATQVVHVFGAVSPVVSQ
jgi:hypothetical protein